MVSILELDQPCRIEDAIAQLRALARLLAPSSDRSDDIVELALSRLLEAGPPVDLDAIRASKVYPFLRQELVAAYDARQSPLTLTNARCLPFPLREAAFLHKLAGLSVSQIARLVGDPETLIETRLMLAGQTSCPTCPVGDHTQVAA